VCLLIVRCSQTRRVPLQQSKDILTAAGANLLGVVLNQLPGREKDYAYYYSEGEAPQRRRLFSNLRSKEAAPQDRQRPAR